MDKILGEVSSESVWLKSLAEHDNVDNFVQLTCSASDFYHTLSPQTSFVLYHENLWASYASQKKRYTVKVYSFRERWGMADIVVPLLNRHTVCPGPPLGKSLLWGAATLGLSGGKWMVRSDLKSHFNRDEQCSEAVGAKTDRKKSVFLSSKLLQNFTKVLVVYRGWSRSGKGSKQSLLTGFVQESYTRVV